MPLFVIFVFGAVVVGGGSMLAPAWPTDQPRIGLAAALALALIMGGSLFLAMLFGWDTLLIDYLLFALVTVIFLGGTLSYGQTRAEKRGEELSDAAQGWPGSRELLFFAWAALVFIIPAVILPVPLDTDAQGFGYLALMARDGGGFETLAPFHPEIRYLYTPGFTMIVAYLSHQLGQGIHQVQLAVGAVLGFVCVLLAFDLGAEIRDKRLGWTMALAMLGGLGLFTAFMDSHYTTLLGLVFALAFIIYTLRYQRHGHFMDAIGAALTLGSVALAHVDTTIILMLGYLPWLLTMWLGQPRPTLRRWLVLAFGVPALAVVAISPWLIRAVLPMLGGEITSPFTRSSDYLRMFITFHGLWTLPAAILGAVIGLRQRNQAAILALGWLIVIIDFVAVGLIESVFPWLPIFRYDYPFSIAWHGPIIPFTILAGLALLWLWERFFEVRLGTLLRRSSSVLLGAGIVVLLLIGITSQHLLVISKDRVNFFGAFASAADVNAMQWIKANTEADARILNFPGTQFDNSHDGDWVPVIAERDSIYYRWQPFFEGNETSIAEQEQLRAFWEDPANPDNAALLADAGVDYVIVPQIVANPNSIETAFRWRMPDLLETRSTPADAPYLELVFEDAGAEVYRFVALSA